MQVRAASAAVLLALSVCLLALALTQTALWKGIELQSYDFLIAMRGPAPPSDRVLIVDFDEDSVLALKAFPVPRPLLAEVIAKVSAGSPAVIGLDIILDRPRDPAADQHLAETIAQAGNVILVSEYGFGGLSRNEPLPAFESAAAGVGFGDLPQDDDGIVRRMHLVLREPGYERLAFPVAVATYATEQSLRPGRSGFLRFGTADIPLATKRPDSALIDFHDSLPAEVVPVQRLLASGFDPHIFREKVVVIGQSSEMGKDLFSAPAFRFRASRNGRSLLSGAEIHAAGIASLLDGRFPHRIAAPLQWTLNFLLAAALIFLLIRVRWWLGFAVLLATTGGVLVATGWLFSHQELWTPFVTTDTCLVLGLPAAFWYRYREEQRLKVRSEAERRQLMSLFERYVSADVAAEIWKRRGEFVLAGEERVATILFSDIRNFTALTAGRPSAEVLAWLNRYLTAMSDVVKANGGFLNKFIGDGIMVVFGVPLSQGERADACRAVQCALQMLEQVDALNSTMGTEEPRLKIGVGIHTGMLTAGNVGSPERLEYSVIGESVNLASRLESLTKEFKTAIVMSASTWERIRESFSAVPLGEAEVRGFSGKMMVYGVKIERAVGVPS
ncbi:MAG: adenylate/guanylate cyclase domain-containing protein [Acidobacteriia bacterium]|nr:adenylate/guanylate cyclase domain-containing protein [Terriglobia bacterium]